MKWLRRAARVMLVLLFLASLAADWIAPFPYARQFRNASNEAPSGHFLLGSDELGRDRLSRLVYGTRISLLLAPAAGVLAVAIALLIGGSAGLAGGWWDLLAMRVTDLFLSLPWIFLFLTARALLPLNVAPAASVTVTFALMGAVGWAASARVIRASVQRLRNSGFALHARACGMRPLRIWTRQLAPHLGVLLFAQFWIAVPVFILGEASLGLLGLGVSEPLPSWGNLLRELESAPSFRAYWVLAPVALLAFVMICFQLALPRGEERV